MSEFIGETPRPHRADVEKRARRDRVFLNNPVIMQGLGLAPRRCARASSPRWAIS